MPKPTKDFGIQDQNFPWRIRRLKKWDVPRMKEWLNSFFKPVNQGGHLLIDLVARVEYERLQVQIEYESADTEAKRRRLFTQLMKLDSKLLTYLRAMGVLKRGKVLVGRKETDDNEPSELSKLIKFRPQPQPEKPKEGKE